MTSAILHQNMSKLSFLKTSLMWERKRVTLVIFRMCKRYKNPYIFLATCHVLSFYLQEVICLMVRYACNFTLSWTFVEIFIM